MSTEEKNKLPLVVICGRTNVGKSTLFNCLTEKHQALVSNIAGTTRDSNLGFVEWANSSFNLVDTAGILDHRELKEVGEKNNLEKKVQSQARNYLDQATLILFLVDNKAGLLPEDRELALELQRSKKYQKKVLLVANKVDSLKAGPEAAQFNKLGIGEPFLISAVSGLGTGDLLDLIIEKIDHEKKNKPSKEKIVGEEKDWIDACIIGKPNVGKSSLLNAILGYERVIVSSVPHTTRESQNTKIIYKEKTINLIDTAGISKQGKKGKGLENGLEKHSIEKSLSSLDKADIALLVIDLSEEITHQDLKIIQEINDRRKSLIIIANKWDRIENHDPKKWTEIVYDRMPFVAYAPIQFISAKTGEKVNKILDLVLKIADERQLQLSDSQTEKFLKHVVKIHKPAKGKGTKAPHIYEFKQIKNNPPMFTLRIGPNDDLHFSYVRFLENRLRERHGFLGTPINVKVSKNKKSHTTYK
jgi:GTP-binding protein